MVQFYKGEINLSEKIDQTILDEILNTKTEVQFMRIVFGKGISKDIWYNNNEIREHFEKIRYKLNHLAEHNIGFLRKKKK